MNNKTQNISGPLETTVTSDGEFWAVCKEGGGDVVAEICHPQGKALAKLIAAAPEMLKALVKLDLYLDDMAESGFGDPEWHNFIKEIIKKATS